jgi:hypothetical protein
MPTLAVFQLLVCRGVLRVLKKFLSRWRIFGSKWRLDMPQAGESERGVSPLLVGGVEILDGRRCKYIFEENEAFNWSQKCRFFRVNFCSSQREIEEIQAAVKMPQN